MAAQNPPKLDLELPQVKNIPVIDLEAIKEKQANQQLLQIIDLSSETIEKYLLAVMANDEAISFTCIQLDNDFVKENYKTSETITWVSEEEKAKAIENELVWSLFYGNNSHHASSVSAIIKNIAKL